MVWAQMKGGIVESQRCWRLVVVAVVVLVAAPFVQS